MAAENRGVLSRSAPVPDVTVGYASHADHVADVWFPVGVGPAPLVLLWHGGFWRPQWDRTHLAPLATALAAEGYVAATVEYRRAGWPSTLTDVAAAADALPAFVEQSTPGRVDLERIVYSGHSAGGQLALWAALRRERPPAPGPVGVLALAPVTDLVDAYRLDLDGGAVEAFLGGGPDEVPDRYAAADPAALGAPEVPVVLLHGDADGRVPVEMSRRYAAATGARLVEIAGADHFSLIDPESAAWSRVLAAVADLS